MFTSNQYTASALCLEYVRHTRYDRLIEHVRQGVIIREHCSYPNGQCVIGVVHCLTDEVVVDVPHDDDVLQNA